MIELNLPETLRFRDGQLELLDQRKLPQRVQYLRIRDLEDAIEAIRTLAVRGAPAIGIAAGYALAQHAFSLQGNLNQQTLQLAADKLRASRPTAVNLGWAVDRLLATFAHDPQAQALVDEAQRIHREDLEICQAIGEHGADIIRPDMGVMTHCNAGSLAVSRLGTATAPMYVQHHRGIPFTVYANETRPLYQGARLTAWELSRAGIDVRLACDNMAASLMSDGRIDVVIVGTDRVTANGDVVNKIGTLNVAILCEHFGIPFYVACPSSTFDRATPSGDEVTIELRPAVEVRGDHAADVPVCNPAFDVTPAALVSGIITEYGIAPPDQLDQLLSPSRR